MESVYNSYIPEELAKKLLDSGFHLYKYNIGDYDGKPSFFTVDEDDPMWETCDRFRIPTYAETLDMLLDRGIIISIKPREDRFEEKPNFLFDIYRFNDYEANQIFAGGPCKNFKEALQYTIYLVISSFK